MTNSQAQGYDAIARVPSGPMISLHLTTDIIFDEQGQPPDWMVRPPFARGGRGVFGENPTVWLIEFFFTSFDRLHHLSPPEESIVSRLAEGRIVGFDVRVRDYDIEPDGPMASYMLGEASYEGIRRQASNWADGLLLGPGGESGETAVQSVSWGRIKASLEIDLLSEDSRPGKD